MREASTKPTAKVVPKKKIVAEPSSETPFRGAIGEVSTPIAVDRELIERRAWEIWKDEGCPEGREMDHWLRAEREILITVHHLK